MIVVDASVLIELLLQTTAAPAISHRIFASGESLCAPHLLDVEVAQVLRRYVRAKTMTSARAEQAIQYLADLPLRRYPHKALLPRIWQLRNNFTAYDAAYLALAEALDAPLLTRDRALASPCSRARVELI